MFGPAFSEQDDHAPFHYQSNENSTLLGSPTHEPNHSATEELPISGFQGDLQHPLKKRKLNDGSFQHKTSTPDVMTPQQKGNIEPHLGIDLNFPIISEVEENPTPSQTCTTPFRDEKSISLRNSGDLRRKLQSNDAETTTPVQYNTSYSESRTYANLTRNWNLESLASLQASLALDKTSETKHERSSPERHEQYGERDTATSFHEMKGNIEREPHTIKSNFDAPAPVNLDTPSKRKVVISKSKGGSQSVCKFPQSGPLGSWSNKKSELKPATPIASDFQGFKARPVPRFVPFEPKKSDRPCVIPQEFHLLTEERGRMKELNLKKELFEKEKMSQSQKVFKAAPLPNYGNMAQSLANLHSSRLSRQLDSMSQSLANLNSSRMSRQPDSRQMSEEKVRYMSRSVSKDSFEGFTSQHFKALPMPNFSKPFKPITGVAPLTEVDEKVLHTETRAERRRVYEDQLRERNQSKEILKEKQEEERKKKEQEEIAELRRQMTFRARPYKGVSSAIKSGQKERPSYSPNGTDQRNMEKVLQNCE